MKILIAEDDQNQQQTVTMLINYWKFDFDLAVNGKEAVEYACNREGEYDLGLMDIDMPVMNGYEATQKIRQKAKYFPIMGLTGNINIEQNFQKAGMDDFLEKPYTFDKLYQKIESLTVKTVQIDIHNNHIYFIKETPMNAQQTSVLKQLKEQNLSMISIFGTSTEATFIVNEVVPEFIEREFAENKKSSVKFLDHNPEAKGLCRLFSKTSMVVKTFMIDEDFESESKNEKNKLKEISIKND
ncbi:MAG: response regulator [Victivallales bacterium]